MSPEGGMAIHVRRREFIVTLGDAATGVRAARGSCSGSGRFRSCALRLRPDRQNELEPRPGLAIRRGGELAAMTLHDHAANGQAQAHSVRLGREKRPEYAVELVWIALEM